MTLQSFSEEFFDRKSRSVPVNKNDEKRFEELNIESWFLCNEFVKDLKKSFYKNKVDVNFIED